MADEAGSLVPPRLTAIFCEGGQCPTCEDGRSMIGPCEDCDEYFAKHGRFPRKRKKKASS